MVVGGEYGNHASKKLHMDLSGYLMVYRYKSRHHIDVRSYHLGLVDGLSLDILVNN